MDQNRRIEQQELVTQIQSRLASFEVDTIMRLLQLRLSDTKDKMLDCPRDELPFVQRDGLVYAELIKLITRPSIKSLTTKE